MFNIKKSIYNLKKKKKYFKLKKNNNKDENF